MALEAIDEAKAVQTTSPSWAWYRQAAIPSSGSSWSNFYTHRLPIFYSATVRRIVVTLASFGLILLPAGVAIAGCRKSAPAQIYTLVATIRRSRPLCGQVCFCSIWFELPSTGIILPLLVQLAPGSFCRSWWSPSCCLKSSLAVSVAQLSYSTASDNGAWKD